MLVLYYNTGILCGERQMDNQTTLRCHDNYNILSAAVLQYLVNEVQTSDVRHLCIILYSVIFTAAAVCFIQAYTLYRPSVRFAALELQVSKVFTFDTTAVHSSTVVFRVRRSKNVPRAI